MDEAQIKQLKSLLNALVRRNVSAEAFEWLEEKGLLIANEKTSTQLRLTFSAMPRKTGRTVIEITEEESESINILGDGFSVKNWTTDRLCRLLILLQTDATDKEAYVKNIEALFRDAEMHELVALYSSLYIFAYPESWQFRTTEGIRSNIGIVLEAIMYENPYPFKYLSELAWNQMVLKAFFTDKDVNRIIGLDERANKPLADILIDYARERWSAHRAVDPQLWRLVAAFVDESNFLHIRKLFENGNHAEKQAAALACFGSTYGPAKQLLASEPYLNNAIEENKLNWHTVTTLI